MLDNFEHVAEVAGWVGELLARTPGIRVLATSRVVLGRAASETLSLLRAWSERTELAEILEILATLAAQEGEVERVVRLVGAAAAIRAAAATPLGDHQRALLARAVGPASAALGGDVLEVAADDLAGGRALTFDQALDYAAGWADNGAAEQRDASPRAAGSEPPPTATT